jgi:hypothetical protein
MVTLITVYSELIGMMYFCRNPDIIHVLCRITIVMRSIMHPNIFTSNLTNVNYINYFRSLFVRRFICTNRNLSASI